MGAYSFQKQFVPFVECGAKQHTIRGIRKSPDRVGNTISCYYAMRNKACRLIGRWPCTRIENILITPGGMVRVNGNYLEDDERETLARADGFQDFATFIAFWSGRLPFRGHIIHWKWSPK